MLNSGDAGGEEQSTVQNSMSVGAGVFVTSSNPSRPTLATRSRLPSMTSVKTSFSEDDEALTSQYGGSSSKDPLERNKKIKNLGLQHPRAIFFLVLWYIFSGVTLFLNKYILTYQNADPHVLCGMQMLITMLCGFIQLRYPLGTYRPIKGQQKPDNFQKRMLTLGLLQLGTIMFGLIAIYYVAVSFAETVKSSAPLFTVLIAYFVLGERTGACVFFSLIPVMLGLALCSSNELSFSMIGFLCALTTNLCECVQSVVSKSLLSNKAYIYNPAELQFYPNLAAVILQFPTWYFLVDFGKLYSQMDHSLLSAIILDGISFHGQTITAYVLMSYVNPVTYSVANTTKRACLIWLSVLLFGNPVTLWSGVGTAVVIVGVLLYSNAREIDARRREQFSITEEKMNAIR
ncbi:solute carrier family 35 member E2A-like isoform X2 [Homarus americanus]|uniref:solute carrier family 35 member E2A-like isoform X2 n=1 Tax=Homarus americanus TaxID=6706 RepID=UPI001C472760|nr:solute carrier family 35 member E2A-like isoform X2 [Homarus americanus]XP_042213909.1 solute carrier family 35 member E2A-like isoform X2 [Homarus americanus]